MARLESPVVLNSKSMEALSNAEPVADNVFVLPRVTSVTRGTPKSTAAEYPQFDLSSGDPVISYMIDPDSFGGEQHRLLRTKLLLAQKEKGIKKILVTSAVPDEGKTTISCSLAGVLAQEPGKRIVLIEADLRRPMAAKVLGCSHPENLPGLGHVLRGEMSPEEVLLKSSDTEFFLLPSGGRANNPAELLSSANLDRALESLMESFDWIVIDSPPVLSLADSALLAAVVDFTLLVVRSSFTSSKLVQEAIRRIGKEKIGGIALNRVKQHNQLRYYHTYYSR
jgi:capsular exopolysaccharide synthesis family protein